MRVKANQYGQYQGRIRETGDVFDIADGDLCHWMTPVTDQPDPSNLVQPAGNPEIVQTPLPAATMVETQHDKDVREWLENEKRAKTHDQGEADQHKAEGLGLV